MINTPVFYNPNSIYPPPNYMSQPYNFPQIQQCVTPPVPYPVNLNNLPQYNPNFRVVPSFQDNFQYNQEEQQFIPQPIISPAPPIYPEYDIYSHDPNELDKVYSPVFHPTYLDVDKQENLFYRQNNIEGLLNFSANRQMKNMYPQIKDNSDFKELLNSKYYQNGVGFINLLDTIAYVKFLREEKLRPINLPANIGFNFDTTDYKKYDTNDYLRILNNFVKSDKISDDLKRYYIAKESKNLSAYYDRMDKISESNDIIKTLL